MRTKTMLLTAALTVAGMSVSMAQVYSVNGVGYVNRALPPGFSIVANPLNRDLGLPTENKLNALFPGATLGSQIYRFTGTGWSIATFSEDEDQLGNPITVWLPAVGATPKVGEGFWVRTAAAKTWTRTFSINP